jgi:hypothetical protein
MVHLHSVLAICYLLQQATLVRDSFGVQAPGESCLFSLSASENYQKARSFNVPTGLLASIPAVFTNSPSLSMPFSSGYTR